MNSLSCDECRAIYEELCDDVRAASARLLTANIPRGQLTTYLQTLNEEDCARMRQTSALWRTWRRRETHRALTGHSVSLLALQPTAISNPNWTGIWDG